MYLAGFLVDFHLELVDSDLLFGGDEDGFVAGAAHPGVAEFVEGYVLA